MRLAEKLPIMTLLKAFSTEDATDSNPPIYYQSYLLIVTFQSHLSRYLFPDFESLFNCLTRLSLKEVPVLSKFHFQFIHPIQAYRFRIFKIKFQYYPLIIYRSAIPSEVYLIITYDREL